MPKLHIAIVVFAIGFSSTAHAQALTAEQRAACKSDYDITAAAPRPAVAVSLPVWTSSMKRLAKPARKSWTRRRKSNNRHLAG
jgi:hypothetical protein